MRWIIKNIFDLRQEIIKSTYTALQAKKYSKTYDSPHRFLAYRDLPCLIRKHQHIHKVLEVEKLILQRAENYQKNKVPLGLFSIFDKLTDKFIRQCDLFPTEKRGELEKCYQDKGIGTEVTRAEERFGQPRYWFPYNFLDLAQKLKN